MFRPLLPFILECVYAYTDQYVYIYFNLLFKFYLNLNFKELSFLCRADLAVTAWFIYFVHFAPLYRMHRLVLKTQSTKRIKYLYPQPEQ